MTKAQEHIRLMEQRIRAQRDKVEQLERSGEDPTESKGRLGLLQRALDEMCIQIAQLSPTLLDEKRDRRQIPEGELVLGGSPSLLQRSKQS